MFHSCDVNWYDLTEFLKRTTGWAKDPGGDKDLICRCPFCGDSVKHKNKGHLYISKTLGLYHCFRCEESGFVEYLLQLLGYNGKIQFKNNKPLSLTSLFPKKVRRLTLPEPKSEDQCKVDYIKSRNVDIHNDIKYRIVWNLDTFLRENNLTISCNSEQYYDLVHNYVGFLTFHGYQVILRRINNKSKFRYFKVDLTRTTIDYYAINCLDFKSWPSIVLCEGPFDIIHAYQKLDIRNAIFVSCSSKGYKRALQWSMYTFGLVKPDIIVVLDKNESYKRYYSFNKYARNLKHILPYEGADIAESDKLCEV